MADWKKAGAMMLGLVALSGCGTVSSVAGHTPHYFPVRNLASHLKTISLSRTAVSHRLTGLPYGFRVTAAGTNLLLNIFRSAGPKWQPGFYLVNGGTGAVRPVVRFPEGFQSPQAASTQHWLVYELSQTVKSGYRQVMAQSLTTGRAWPILTLPQQVYSAGDVRGLTIVGDRAYWLSNLLTSNGIESRVYMYNLVRRHLSLLIQENPKRQGILFFGAAGTPQGLWLSADVSHEVNASQTGGALWFWSYAAGRVTKRFPVFHAPNGLEGATQDAVVFSANYSAADTSKVNPGPFPTYAANWTARRVEQLTSRINPGGAALVDGSSVVIDGVGMQSVLINLSKRTITYLPVPHAAALGPWLVFENARSLSWERLPGS